MKIWEFVVQNKAFFGAMLGLILSEAMSLNPKWASNGILQWVGQQLKKIAEPTSQAPKA